MYHRPFRRLLASEVQTQFLDTSGGDPVVHNFFFDDWTPPFKYKTVDELEQHVNGVSGH